MRHFYTKQHRFYCGIDLHARLLAVCIVDHETASVVCRTQIPADKEMLLDTLAPYRATSSSPCPCRAATDARRVSRDHDAEPNPRRAVELHGLTEASQG